MALVLFFVQKNDETLRTVVDCHALYKQTIQTCTPTLIYDLFDLLVGAQIFMHINLSQGYLQTLISDEDVPKIAFRT